jgi:hypothetical protein
MQNNRYDKYEFFYLGIITQIYTLVIFAYFHFIYFIIYFLIVELLHFYVSKDAL